MTLQRINHQPERLHYAFHSKERDYIQILINRANNLLELIVNKKATDEERKEYHSLKWMMKQVCAIDNDNLEKVNDEKPNRNDG